MEAPALSYIRLGEGLRAGGGCGREAGLDRALEARLLERAGYAESPRVPDKI